MGKNDFISNRSFKKHHFKPRTGVDTEELLNRILRASETIQESTRRGAGDWVIYTGMEGASQILDLELDVYGPGSSTTYVDILPTLTVPLVEDRGLWSQLSANTVTI